MRDGHLPHLEEARSQDTYSLEEVGLSTTTPAQKWTLSLGPTQNVDFSQMRP